MFANIGRMESKNTDLQNGATMDDELRDLAEIMQEEHEKQVYNWTKAKEELCV
jgi:hypothetical protein